jgi:hypothetical protein
MTIFRRRLGGANAVRWVTNVVAACGFLLAAHPAGADPLDLSYTAYRLGGAHTAAIQSGESVHTGEKFLIKVKYINQATAAAPAGAIILSLPVGCAFVQSRSSNPLAVSVDGGREFGLLDRLQVRRNGAVRAATGEDVTHIRLTLDHAVAPGQGGEISIVAAQEWPFLSSLAFKVLFTSFQRPCGQVVDSREA